VPCWIMTINIRASGPLGASESPIALPVWGTSCGS
jgi:hypothetical protein